MATFMPIKGFLKGMIWCKESTPPLLPRIKYFYNEFLSDSLDMVKFIDWNNMYFLVKWLKIIDLVVPRLLNHILFV